MKRKPTESSPKSVRDPAGRFLPGHDVGIQTRWRDVSGNPPGNTAARRRFEQAFYASLLGEGSPKEAAKLLWDAARNREPWAISNLLGRIAPTESRLKITTQEETNGTYDLTQLNDQELEQFIQLASRARGAAQSELAVRGNPVAQLPAGGEGTAPAA
jgi:hypothetical protein